METMTRGANANAIAFVEMEDPEMAHVDRVDEVRVMVDSDGGFSRELDRGLGRRARPENRLGIRYEQDMIIVCVFTVRMTGLWAGHGSRTRSSR